MKKCLAISLSILVMICAVISDGTTVRVFASDAKTVETYMTSDIDDDSMDDNDVKDNKPDDSDESDESSNNTETELCDEILLQNQMDSSNEDTLEQDGFLMDELDSSVEIINAGSYQLLNAYGIVIDINREPYPGLCAKNQGGGYAPNQCAWFASARAYELTSNYPGAKSYYEVARGVTWWNSGKYAQIAPGGTVSRKAMACYTNHNLIIEGISGGEFIVSQNNSEMSAYGASADTGYCVIHTQSRSKVEQNGTGLGDFLGYLDLGVPFDYNPYASVTENVSFSDIKVSYLDSYYATVNGTICNDVALSDYGIKTREKGKGGWIKVSCGAQTQMPPLYVSKCLSGTPGTEIEYYLYAVSNNSGIEYKSATKTYRHPNTGMLDLNGYLDNKKVGSLEGYGTVDIYLYENIGSSKGWKKVEDDCGDYNYTLSDGQKYKIDDIKAFSGKKYTGVYSGELTGTIKANTTIDLRLTFVSWKSVTGVSLNKTSLSLDPGGTATLKATVTPSNASDKSVKWSSSNTSVATVNSSGKVTAKAVGKCTITVKTTDSSKTAKCTVTVKQPVTGVSLNKQSLTLNTGETESLTATVSPSDATNKNVTWSSSNTGIATVDTTGKVTAVAPGTCAITVKTADGGKTASCDVTVIQPVGGISLDKQSITLHVGQSEALKATITPKDASNQVVIWSSDDTGVACVDQQGNVTAVSAGNCTITVKTEDGNKTATCAVKVQTEAILYVEEGDSISKTYGDVDFMLHPSVPDDGNGGVLSYSVGDPSVATISDSGMIHILKSGESSISVVYESASCHAQKMIKLSVAPRNLHVSWNGTGFVKDGNAHVPQAALSGVLDGDDVSLVVSVTDENGNTLSQSVEAGNYRAIASLTGARKDDYSLNDREASCDYVILEAVEDSIWIEPIPDQVYTGTAIKPVPVVHYRDKTLSAFDYTVTYKNNTNAAASDAVNEKTGAVTAPSVIVRGKGNYAGTATLTFGITPLDLSAADVSDIVLACNDRVQKGKSRVTYVLNGRTVTLAANRDYTLEYYVKDNNGTMFLCDPQEPGIYEVIVRGKGNYRGTASYTQTITSAVRMISRITVPSIPTQTYNGKRFVLEQTQVENENLYTRVQKKNGQNTVDFDFVLKSGSTILEYNKDYSLSYMNNAAVGTATVTITGKGDYRGTRKTTFRIDGKAMSRVKLLDFLGSIPYNNGMPVEQTAKLHDPSCDYTLRQGIDYTVDYSNDHTQIGTVTVTYTGKGIYYGTIKKNYQITGVPMSKVAVPADLSITTGNDGVMDYRKNYRTDLKAFMFTGKPFYVAGVPAEAGSASEDGDNRGIVLSYTDSKTNEFTTLIKGKDYTVSYQKCELPGMATVVFTGIGRYSGTVKRTFIIKACDVNTEPGRFTIECGDTFRYTKGGVKPVPDKVQYQYGDIRADLENGRDYTLSWSYNTAVTPPASLRKPVVTITFKGAYTGKKPIEFTILGSGLSDETVRIRTTDVIYADNRTGICKTTPTITDVHSGAKLVAGTDYEKNYSYTYASDTEVKCKTDARTTVPTTRLSGEAVDLKRDIIPAGTRINVLITGKGYYAGNDPLNPDRLQASFYFVRKNLSSAAITIDPKTYNGSPITLDPEDVHVRFGKDPELEYGVAYEIEPGSYVNNTNKGTARVTIRAIPGSNYSGSKVVNFKIAARSMDYTINYDPNLKGFIDGSLALNDPTWYESEDIDAEHIEEWVEGHFRIAGTMKASTTPYGKKLTKNTYKVQKLDDATGVWADFDQYKVGFAGWTTRADGKGELYADQAAYKPFLMGRLVTRRTLYAKWEVME